MKKSSKMLPVAICLALLTLTACTMTSQPIGNPEAPYPPTTQLAVGDIYHLPTGVKVSAEQIERFFDTTKRRFGVHGRYAVFCPGAEYGPAKRWPYFADLSARLEKQTVIRFGRSRRAKPGP